jgi:hypothetical protein
MNMVIEQSRREQRGRCAVCATHSRPAYVPWQQHAVGCAVRASALARPQPELQPTLRFATNLV